ncbi:MAG TPA: hypothetical protein VGR38_09995 [Candidatus Polarisedimenticolia bacterium]|jgi:hypothetical protein|nr:hypothetical protein [Candidatus Polarisedimenticolia bacterium]
MNAFWRGSILTLSLAVVAASSPEQSTQSPEISESPGLKPDDAERLFLKFINDKASLIRSCMFLGGVKLGEIIQDENKATVEIRYRIRCQQEEIDMPPLDRTMREDYVYHYVRDHWELIGRASELAPSAKQPPPPGTGSAPPEKPDPTRADRQRIAEQVLAWAALGSPPPGIHARFPGGTFFASAEKVWVSDENLGGVEALELHGREVEVLSPAALLQRAVLQGGGVWLRFESLDVDRSEAHAVVSIMTPILPPPAPGESPTRTLSRVSAAFLLRQTRWTMTRFRPI